MPGPWIGLALGGLARGLGPGGVQCWAGGLTCVNVGVLLHVRLLVEALATELAGVGPGVRVDEQVGGQRGRALEGFATHPALKAALLPEETRPRGVRCRRGLATRDCQAGRRTGPGRNPLRNRTLHWGGLKDNWRNRTQGMPPPPRSCLPGGAEAWGLRGRLWNFSL